MTRTRTQRTTHPVHRRLQTYARLVSLVAHAHDHAQGDAHEVRHGGERSERREDGAQPEREAATNTLRTAALEMGGPWERVTPGPVALEKGWTLELLKQPPRDTMELPGQECWGRVNPGAAVLKDRP